MRARLAASGTVSRNFNLASEERIKQLQQITLKPNSESKVNWAVGAYNEWRMYRLETFNYDFAIYNADLNELSTLRKDNLCHALCRFVPEVTKKKGGGLYPGLTLYQMLSAIQKYLNVNKINWQIPEGKDPEFEDVRVVLDNVMKERTAQNIGVTKRQANVVTSEIENRLWEQGILGEDTPEKLRDTVLFLLGLNVTLRAIDAHYNLRRDMPTKPSQLQFEKDDCGVRCLVYREDFVTKSHDGGLKDRKNDRKIVWVYPNADTNRCTVRLVEKYLGLCPLYFRKENFYLQCRMKPTPKLWYQEQVIGKNTISKVVKQLVKKGKIDGFFTNHSLRRSGGTRLFRAGVDRKLVKEFTGHRSDAVELYQVTSFEQRKMMSNVVQGGPNRPEVLNVEKKSAEVEEKSSEVEQKLDKTSASDVSKREVTKDNVSEIVKSLLNATKNRGKTVIRIEVEVHND